jgi:hypothetical protein
VAAEPGAPGARDQCLRLVGRFDREPEGGVALRRGADDRRQVRVGLADALDRDPVVPEAGPPGDRPLAARDDVRSETGGRREPDDGRDIVRLDRVLADPRVGEGRRELARRGADSRFVGDLDRGAEPARRGSQRVGDRRQPVGRVSRGRGTR